MFTATNIGGEKRKKKNNFWWKETASRSCDSERSPVSLCFSVVRSDYKKASGEVFKALAGLNRQKDVNIWDTSPQREGGACELMRWRSQEKKKQHKFTEKLS